MSQYSALSPIFAASVMHVNHSGWFSNLIRYDYCDNGATTSPRTYREFLQLKAGANYQREITLYWTNLQQFLDQEINQVNKKSVHQQVRHCHIGFHDNTHPFVQWIIEFRGDLQIGENCYENQIEEENLEYPIHSLYVFESPMHVTTVKSNLSYELHASRQILEYRAQPGDHLGEYEAIFFLR